MATGTVIRFDEVRGYGFIAPDGGGEDVFVHVNALADDKHAFAPGVPVEFELLAGDRGLKASAVRLARPLPESGQQTAPVRQAASGANRTDEDYDLADVLSPAEFRRELTEVLLDGVPTLTGGQIVQVRQRMEKLARAHGWVEP